MAMPNTVLGQLLATLNKQQRIAVEFDPNNALQVIAGPGTGKTKVLTSRVVYLLLHHKIEPKDIVVTTFTNKAAKEMMDRLAKMLSGTAIRVDEITIGTFHSICLRVLLKYGFKVGLNRGWRIVEEKEVEAIIHDLIKTMPDQIRDYANSYKRSVNLCRPTRNKDEWAVHPQMVKKEISRLKSNALLPEEYENDSNHDPALAHFYTKYQSELGKLNALDFDDLLMYTFRLLTKERCLPDIKHVLVDEFQDTNSIQMDLMFLFAKGDHHVSRGITVVGDPDQSIYAFRNALAQNFQQMQQKTPLHCSQVVLVENYRSSQKILDTSETLIQQQIKGRTHRAPLRAQFDVEFPPVYVNFPVGFLQSASIAREILYLKALPNLFSYNDFSILVRQRRQIKNIETALIEHRIPYKIVKGRAFWELKEISAMMHLIKCAYSDNEKFSILSSLLYPAKGLGQTSADKIKKIFEDNPSQTPFSLLQDIEKGAINLTMTTKVRSVIKDFIQMINFSRSFDKAPLKSSLENIFDTLYERSGMKNEYLYFDGGKKSDTNDSNREANYENPRHKNILLLKKYFLGIDEIEDFIHSQSDQKTFIEDIQQVDTNVIRSYIRTFFNSLSLYATESTSSDNEIDRTSKRKNSRNGEACVTISTIHGAKGLEWPVVFIPGCIEGIIPSIFSRDESSSETESDTEEEGTNTSDKNVPKSNKKSSSLEEPVDEERRMFFVAQTRAKLLLYLSSIKEGENPTQGGPSRFLTPEVRKTLINEQNALKNEKNIELLYKSMNKKVPSDLIKRFSLKKLVQDYAQFIENRRESMIWNGRVIRNSFTLDITRNTVAMDDPISDFTTAAAHLQTEVNKKPVLERQFQTMSRKGSTLSSTSKLWPKKAYAPQANQRLSPSPPKVHAPTTTYPLQESPTKKKSYAPSYPHKPYSTTGTEFKIKQNKTDNDNILEKPFPISASNDRASNPKMLATSKGSTNEAIKKELFSQNQVISSPKRISRTKSVTRKLIVSPIMIEDKKRYEEVKKNGSVHHTVAGDRTAAEILHDPDDLIIDNRPILTSAKTLMKAIKKADSKSNQSSQKSFSEHQLKTEEASSSQFDILSQLSRAKKKAKLNDGEIIVIDD
ncbi:hypothetical protein KAFR_0A01450 [Kazachstania africana CBS 2517]|uniref:DNA 3'-5' helicase n=1 Tax=Kazachstania africana (strain ATCC 22294 / BCRC 22015 / CBS 2517 / CECT 1963 / NBRC 1671 / NRRL Y-8276) TaxID=1071382 RepID=H2AMI3_KAZAF|nr:hypothetical protein KAFR_0A01450 [Kazachstania africana CBS 2517]CCF55583.1 hypothetical protein KAFR_0A01450 [Kazachstania africana CBS 2517]